MFKIMGMYQGEKEEIDSFDTMEEARKMITEYRMAYGNEWRLWIRKGKA